MDEAFFMPASDGRGDQRFCLYHPSRGPVTQGSVMYVHPFGEEMNKSRRMAAMQSRAMAKAGYAVLRMDLLGCGDSAGDFGDATWKAWVSDVVLGCHWLRERSTAPLWLWGLRAGCLLAAEAAQQLVAPYNFIFWAPAPAGKTLLQQFLRLKVAGDMLGRATKGITEGLRQQLAEGTAVEIAGYVISPGLAHGMEQSVLTPPDARHGATAPPKLEWYEMSTRVEASLSPVAQKSIDHWKQNGFQVQTHFINGPSFWQTQEIEDATALVLATTSALTATPRPPSYSALT